VDPAGRRAAPLNWTLSPAHDCRPRSVGVLFEPATETAMSDDRNNVGRPDRDRINVNEDHELRYWTKALGVDEAQLRAAVKAVGPTAAAVREHLKKS